MWGKLLNYCDCSEDEQNKMLLGEVSIFHSILCPRAKETERRRLSSTLYPLSFMTQIHLEVCTESFGAERIIPSLAAIGLSSRES